MQGGIRRCARLHVMFSIESTVAHELTARALVCAYLSCLLPITHTSAYFQCPLHLLISRFSNSATFVARAFILAPRLRTPHCTVVIIFTAAVSGTSGARHPCTYDNGPVPPTLSLLPPSLLPCSLVGCMIVCRSSRNVACYCHVSIFSVMILV